MWKKRMNLLLAVMVGVMTTVAGLAGEKHLVRLKMKKGDIYRFGYVFEFSGSGPEDFFNAGGIKGHIFFLNEWKCTAVKGENFLVTVSIKRIVLSYMPPDQMISDSGGKRVEYCLDTANKATITGKFEALKAILHICYHVVFNNRGEVIEVVVPKDMEEKAFEAAGLSDSTRKHDLEHIFQIMRSPIFKSVIQGIMRGTCPEQAVGVGDTWEEKYSIPVDENASLVISGTYKLMKVDGDILHVKYHGELNLKLPETVEDPPKYSGPQDITLRIDKKTGFVVSSDLHQKVISSFHDRTLEINLHIKVVAGKKELEELLKEEDKRVANRANVNELIKQAHEIGSKPEAPDEE